MASFVRWLVQVEETGSPLMLAEKSFSHRGCHTVKKVLEYQIDFCLLVAAIVFVVIVVVFPLVLTICR